MEGKRMTLLALGIATALLLVMLAAERWGTLPEGSRAPGFTAPASTGETIRLADFAGEKNVVLFFYPKDFTAGCTEQACAFRDAYEELRALNAVVFGVSGDTRASHEKFAGTHRLPYPLISDSSRAIARAYGVLRLGGVLPLPKRVTYVIDRKGVIRMVVHHELQMGRHVEEALAVLRRIQVEG
jgi:peroxiredoxin Q/BCP